VERSVYYEGCNEVRAAGKAPLYRGNPGYGEHMDGDGDGDGVAGRGVAWRVSPITESKFYSPAP
jgi:Excalibur calcium-binding domain